ncbi:MAG TPA: response regulator transcription factor [Thermoleophilia bacterium]|nr:response regulator transcription factor [Thermoleophilia bacterium]
MEEGVRILIIHRNRLFREGLACVLAQQQIIRVVGAAGEVLEELEKLGPDVILLDFCLPERKGLQQAERIRGVLPDARILMIGLAELESDILACIESGVAGYLTQDASIEDLLNQIQAVTTRQTLCSPRVAGFLFSRIVEGARERQLRKALGPPNLTRRELEIVALIEERLSNKEIAVRLQIELQTVKNHIHNMLEKLKLNGRREAAAYARERGLLMGLPWI